MPNKWNKRFYSTAYDYSKTLLFPRCWRGEERCPGAPLLPVHLGAHLSFGSQKEDKWFIVPPGFLLRETVKTPKLGTLGSPNPSQPPHAASTGDWYPAVRGTWYGTACGSPELEHHDGCSTSHVSQEGTLINSQVFSEETEATESSWLPKVKQKLAGLFILFASSRVALCVLSTKRVLQTQTTFLGLCCYFWWVWSHPSPTPKLLLLAGSLTKHISRGQALSHSQIINYLIKNSQLKAEFSLWGREKVTGGDAMR